jgi:hypothetical protein
MGADSDPAVRLKTKSKSHHEDTKNTKKHEETQQRDSGGLSDYSLFFAPLRVLRAFVLRL